MNLICTNKSKINNNIIIDTFKKWLNINMAFHWGYEMHYYPIERKIFAESYMSDGNDSLIDYKFICFNGVPTYCQVIGDRKNKLLNWYNMDWDWQNISRLDFKSDKTKLDKCPNNFEKMKTYASIFSKDFKFVRVDFYEINNIIYLGELTFTPASRVHKI